MAPPRKNNASGYFFTVVIYPDEFGQKVKLLYNLGSVYFSPIHHGDYLGKPKSEFEIVHKIKDHQHLMIRAPTKMTANAFIIKLMDLLHNDITGIAISKEFILVTDPAQMLRYFYHLDNPLKEHFPIETALDDVLPNFTDVVIKAFDKEIRGIVLANIFEGNVRRLKDVCTLGCCSIVFQEWLFKGKNGYVVKQMIDEERKFNND